MHLIWNISVIDFAKTVGVYKDGMSGDAASAAWNQVLDKNCR
jgi:hypothetical protein